MSEGLILMEITSSRPVACIRLISDKKNNHPLPLFFQNASNQKLALNDDN